MLAINDGTSDILMTDGKICVRCREEVGHIDAIRSSDGHRYMGTTIRYTISQGDLVCESCLGEWKNND